LSTIKDLGFTTNADVIDSFLSLSGAYVLDAGCGKMGFTQTLTERGACVVAIDPDPVQAELNRQAINRTDEPLTGIEFVETGAEALPVDDNSIDGVFFAYSLHHVPVEVYPNVFAEIRRAVKPGGFLYVIEPMSCPLMDVMDLFHPEVEERAAAQKALQELAVPFFESAAQVTYHGLSQYESFDQFADVFSSKSFNNCYSEADVRRPEVKEAFEKHGAPDYKFASPKVVMCLKGLRKMPSD
jgi:ubiquinone/menaquinone biosynthesis C-methylase UbiE